MALKLVYFLASNSSVRTKQMYRDNEKKTGLAILNEQDNS